MKRVHFQDTWPDSWKTSYPYDLQEIYGEVSHRGYAGAYRLRRQETLRVLTEVLPKGASVLEIGAAQGNFSLSLAELGYQVTWNDLRAELADYVKMKHEHGEIDFPPGNAFELKFASLFDGILIAEIIEHVAHPDDFLHKASQLVKPGGRIVMTTPNGAYFRNSLPQFSDCKDPSVYESVQFKPNADGHIFLLHPEEVAVLGERAGLVLEKLILCINPLTAGHVKTAPLLNILPESFVGAVEDMTHRMPFALRRKALTQMIALFWKPE